MDMAGMIFLGLVLAGLAEYLVYALVYPEKL
jgi:K+-transporting ATPase KdpF subunit